MPLMFDTCRKFRPSFLVILTSLALCACTTRFHDDFEADTAGQPPLSSPPSPQADELIVTFNPFYTPTPGAIVIPGSAALKGKKSVEWLGPISSEDEYTNTVITMISEPLKRKDRDVIFTWDGLTGPDAEVQMYFEVPHADGHLRVQVVFLDGGLRAGSGSRGDWRCGLPACKFGTYNKAVPHQVRVTVNAKARSAAIRITEIGGTVRNATVKNLQIQPSSLSKAYMYVIPRGGKASRIYVIDDVYIQERN